MDWKPVVDRGNNEYKIPERWLHIHYYEALNILFRFENSLRVFVYATLKNKYFDEWKNQTFNTNDHQKSIANLAAKRISQAANFGYLGYDVKCPIMHLTSGELIDLLTNDTYWPIFKSYFRGTKEIIKNKLQEINSIRNSLAHFRPIKSDDVEVIKQNVRHTLLEIEVCLDNIFNQNQKIPTNSNEEWYKNISTLGNQFIRTNLLHSKDEDWVNLQLIFITPTLHKSAFGESHITFKVAKLITSNIVKLFPELAKYVTYISERTYYPALRESDLTLKKSVNIVIEKSVLTKHWHVIHESMIEIITKLSEEVELLIQDNLARGELLETASCYTYLTSKDENRRRVFEYNNLKRPYQPGDPDEYWGDFYNHDDDIVAGSPIYPWMPSQISIDDSLL